MSDKPAEASATPPRGKKLLLVMLLVLLVLVLGGGGAWFYINKQRAAMAAEEDEPAAQAQVKGPPTYLPLDSMVVNLADPGGEKVAQIGITLELLDAHATDTVKQYLPTIRSGVLLLVSQRTSEELLQREGKEKLAADILREASRPFGGVQDAPEEGAQTQDEAGSRKARPKSGKKAKGREEQPVQRVLFSSFIVQ